MGKKIAAITIRPPEYGDLTLNKVLKDLQDKKLYSKDIQNIIDPNDYNKTMNLWKKWLNINKINKNTNLKFIDYYNDIKEEKEMKLNNILNKIEFILLNESKANKEDLTVLKLLSNWLKEINNIRNFYFKCLQNIDIREDKQRTDLLNALKDDLKMSIEIFKDPAKNTIWKKGKNLTIIWNNFYDWEDSYKDNISLNKNLSKDLVKLGTSLTLKFPQTIKDILEYILLKYNQDDQISYISAVYKDLKPVLTAGILKDNSIFWTKNRDVTMMWSNFYDKIGM